MATVRLKLADIELCTVSLFDEHGNRIWSNDVGTREGPFTLELAYAAAPKEVMPSAEDLNVYKVPMSHFSEMKKAQLIDWWSGSTDRIIPAPESGFPPPGYAPDSHLFAKHVVLSGPVAEEVVEPPAEEEGTWRTRKGLF
jgi:hypothetical protein